MVVAGMMAQRGEVGQAVVELQLDQEEFVDELVLPEQHERVIFRFHIELF